MRAQLLFAGALALAIAIAPAHAQRAEVEPYIQVGQVLTADLQSGDVLTYSYLAAGVDASVQTRRAQVQLSYQYDRRIAWDDDVSDDEIHTGLARAAVAAAPGVNLEGGALATRARADIRGDAPPLLAGNVDNIAQIYSVYAGPTVQTGAGPAALNAAYRFGYTKAEAPDAIGLRPGEPPLDLYDDATSHLATASIGTRAGTVLPVGVTLSGAYQREDASQLDQRYEGAFVRGDVVAPVSREVALVAGAGYEDIEISQRDALVGADGLPVTDGSGRFVTDPASPRRIAFETDSLFWDAGVLWRPSPRTSIEARIGRRYDSWTYIGSLSHQTGPGSGLQIGVYDSVQSFGRQLRDGLAMLPTSFNDLDDPFGQGYNGCIFGTSGGAVGGCLSPVFQSIATANYRARGVDAVFAWNRGPTRFGIGAGYANRRFYAPDTGFSAILDGVTDESWYAQAFAAHQLDRNSGLTGDLFINYYDPGLALSNDIWSTGATGTYYRSFGRLNATASAGIYTFDQEGFDSDVQAQALLGLGYRF